MNFEPVQVGQLKLKPDANGQLVNSIGIDFGEKLMKVVYLKEGTKLNKDGNDENVAFYDFIIGKLEDTKHILEYVKNSAGDIDEIKSTGLLLNSYKTMCESIFGKPVKVVPTETAITTGIITAFRRIGVDQLLSQSVESENIQNSKIESEMMERMMESFKSRINQEGEKSVDGIFPCIVLHVGSNMTGIYIDGSGEKYEIYSNLGWSGSTFLSLAKCMADVNEYDECFRLIKTGDIKAVDTLVQDVLSEDKDSPYGKFPKDMPIFSFGKCMDENIGNEKLKKEDMLKSLMGMIMQHIWNSSMFLCKIKKNNKVYLCGNLFQSKELEKEIRFRMSFFPSIVDLKVLDYGYNKALGALTADC